MIGSLFPSSLRPHREFCGTISPTKTPLKLLLLLLRLSPWNGRNGFIGLQRLQDTYFLKSPLSAHYWVVITNFRKAFIVLLAFSESCVSFFFLPPVLGIEFGVLSLLGKCSTTWASPPVFLLLVCFSDKLLCFWPGWTQTMILFLYLRSNWDYRYAPSCPACFFCGTEIWTQGLIPLEPCHQPFLI
jgi:hypothetical protein